MRLIMCCQKIDGRDFRSDLRFSFYRFRRCPDIG